MVLITQPSIRSLRTGGRVFLSLSVLVALFLVFKYLDLSLLSSSPDIQKDVFNVHSHTFAYPSLKITKNSAGLVTNSKNVIIENPHEIDLWISQLKKMQNSIDERILTNTGPTVFIKGAPTPPKNDAPKSLHLKYLNAEAVHLVDSIANNKTWYNTTLAREASLYYNLVTNKLQAIKMDKSISSDPKQKPTPICLVSFWEDENISTSAVPLFESVARNHGYANLHYFIHRGPWYTKHHKKRQSYFDDHSFKNVNLMDLRTISNSFAYRGYPGFIASRLCRHFKIVSTDATEEQVIEHCSELENALTQFQNTRGQRTLLSHLVPLYPIIFKEWINADKCDSWAAVSTQSVFGDLQGWFDNPIIQNSDIITLHESDWWRVYLRKRFILHNLKRKPQQMISLYKYCPKINSFHAMINTFSNSTDADSKLLEGCYSYGVLMRTKLDILALPWTPGTERRPTLISLFHGHLMLCTGNSNAEICRGSISKKITSYKGIKIDPNEKFPFSKPEPTRTLPLVIKPITNCSPWLESQEQICVGESGNDVPKLDWSSFQYFMKISSKDTNRVIEILEYPQPQKNPAHPGFLDGDVGFYPFVDFSDYGWNGEFKIDQTFWYNGGSMTFGNGFLMFDTMDRSIVG